MITILGNVGNQGFALPMVQAYPTNPNNQQILVWDPVNGALNYVPIAVDPVTGNMTLPGDLSVGDDLTVTDQLSVGGLMSVVGAITGQASMTLGPTATPANQVAVTPGANPAVSMGGTQVLTRRQTGWVAMTGTPVKATRATGTVTLADLAGIVMAMQADLITHGIIGT